MIAVILTHPSLDIWDSLFVSNEFQHTRVLSCFLSLELWVVARPPGLTPF